MLPIDEHVLQDIAPHFSGEDASHQADIIGAIGGSLRPILEEYDIDTMLRIAHFLAQICEESAGLRTTVEFASGAEYEGRKDLGNVEPGDGPRYKGRGLIQLTGRANYAKFGSRLGLDLEDDPDLAAEPQTSLKIGCEYWRQNGLNVFADQDDIVTITRRINGGTNGLDARRGFLVLAKAALARLAGGQVAAAAPGDTRPILRRGSQNDHVADLQRKLRALGFALAVDGDFGAATELAVMHFQAGQGIDRDGIVGPQTWDALAAAGGGAPDRG